MRPFDFERFYGADLIRDVNGLRNAILSRDAESEVKTEVDKLFIDAMTSMRAYKNVNFNNYHKLKAQGLASLFKEFSDWRGDITEIHSINHGKYTII